MIELTMNADRSGPITDTPAHTCDAILDADRPEFLGRAQAAGVTAIIGLAENLADARKNLELAPQYSMIRPAATLHPTVLDLGIFYPRMRRGPSSRFARLRGDPVPAQRAQYLACGCYIVC